MSDLALDLRLAWRHWTRRPLLPTAVVLTLTAGLGLALAVFAIAWAVVWRPLDVPHADRLVWVASDSRGAADGVSPGAALTWRDEARTLDAVAAMRSVVATVTEHGVAERLEGRLVTASLMDVLGVTPVAGRPITVADDTPGAPRVLMLTHAAWQARYSGRADVVGRALAVDGRPATIVGVLPATLDAILPDAAWVAPLALAPSERGNIGPRYLEVVARLAPLATPALAHDELAGIGARLGLTADDGTPLGTRVTPLVDHLTARYRPGLLLLLGGVALLVLIACGNVAALLLTRAQDRQAELALRASLGASTPRLVRQLLIEAGLLAALAASGGLVAALWLVDALRAWLPADVPRLADAHVDATTAVAAFGAAAVVTLAAGLAPALRGARVDLQAVLRHASTSLTASDRTRRVFVAAQVALAVVVACAGVLVIRSASALAAAPRGYESRGVAVASLSLPPAYRNGPEIGALVDRLVTRVATVPGVTDAAVASHVPLAGGSAGSDVRFAGEAAPPGVDLQTRVRLVSAHYLRTLGVRVTQGRDIGPEDGATTPPVVVVNETLARRLGGGGSIVGRALSFGVPVFNGSDGARTWRIVGVAADTFDRGPREPVAPEVLLPIAQAPADVFFWISRELQVAVRTDRGAGALGGDIRAAAADVEPALPLGPLTALDDALAANVARERLLARLLTGIGLTGIALALLGLVAVVHHDLQRRRREIAIRLAVGAEVPAVVRALVRRGVGLALVGAIVGITLSAATSAAMASLLFGVTPGDAVTRVVVGGTIVALATMASWLPARSAAAIDPAEALRTP
ncbi:MAG: ADOP family duplicated permease [Vicinamibacterales bacterium]